MAGQHPPRLSPGPGTPHRAGPAKSSSPATARNAPDGLHLEPPYSARQGRRFAFLVGGAGAVCALLAVGRGHPIGGGVAGVVAVTLLCAGVFFPARLRRVEAAWLSLSHALSRVTTPVMLTVVWLVGFVPMALLLRLVGKRPLARADNAPTFWQDRDASHRRSDPKRLF